jgi:hypothetical protein
MITTPDIETLLDAIADKLPELDVVGQKQSYITGQELILCGHKMWAGEFIQPKKMYTINVPIAKGEIEPETKAIQYKRLDHKSKLKSKWRVDGLNGIYHYLRAYLTDEQMKWVKEKFMSVSIQTTNNQQLSTARA